MANIYHVLVILWGVPHLWEAANRDFCCPDLHLRPFRLALLGCAENLHQPLLAKPPRALRSFLAAGKERIKMSWRKGVWSWISCGSTCGHLVFTPLLALWVCLLGLKCYLPPAVPARRSSSWHTKEMLKLPLQLREGGRRFLKGAKM